MFKIYTKTGDKGETSLYAGQRVLKNDPFVEALGAVDECNCSIGAALAFIPTDPQFSKTREQLYRVQHSLFDLGASLATPRTRAADDKLKKTRFGHEDIVLLEKWIDDMDETLPQLQSFILPGGHAGGAMLHVARGLCRRAERFVVPLNKRTEVSDDVLMYLNRLSDYLFVVSRYVNHLLEVPEMLWKKQHL